MSRDPTYQKLLNSKRWRELRLWKLEQCPLCERCKAAGYVVAAVDVHHIMPVQTATTPAEMEALTFNPHNLQALCIACHVEVHKELGKSTRDNHQQRTDENLQRWIARHTEPGAKKTRGPI